MIGLIYSGAVSRLWYAAAEQIDAALELLIDSGGQATKYFISISVQCRESARLIEEAARELPEFKESFLQGLIEEKNTQCAPHKIRTSAHAYRRPS